MAATRLSRKQALVYGVISAGPSDLTQIREITGLPTGTVSVILAQLERRQLIAAEERFALPPRYRIT